MIHRIAYSLLLAVFVIVGMVAPQPAMAASRNLTVTVTNWGAIVVDQVTGAISYCYAYGSAGPSITGSCLKIGTATPSSTLPTPQVGLSVYQATTNSGSTYTSGLTIQTGDVWLVNNTTGDVTYCYFYPNLGSPQGVCKDLGIAPQ